MADQPPKTAPRRSCLKCGYSLETLPVVHTCPECGLDYDPHSVMIPLLGRSRRVHDAVIAAFLLASLFWSRIEEKRSFSESIPCIAPALIIVLFGVHRWLRGIEHGKHLVISHKGIRLNHPDFRSRLITWDEYGSVRVNRWTGRFKILNSRGKKVFSCYCDQLGSRSTARALALDIDRLAAIYTRPDWKDLPKVSRPVLGPVDIAHHGT